MGPPHGQLLAAEHDDQLIHQLLHLLLHVVCIPGCSLRGIRQVCTAHGMRQGNLTLPIGKGRGCGSGGRAVASDSRGPRFESSHWQKFKFILNICLLSTVY